MTKTLNERVTELEGELFMLRTEVASYRDALMAGDELLASLIGAVMKQAGIQTFTADAANASAKVWVDQLAGIIRQKLGQP